MFSNYLLILIRAAMFMIATASAAYFSGSPDWAGGLVAFAVGAIIVSQQANGNE